jgi:F0F1-type ATP synthase membrane subunit b/b'
MAKKKVARPKAQSKPMLSQIQSGIKKMRRDAETFLSQARKEAARLSRDQKRSVDRVLSEARRLRSDLQKVVKQTSKELESRSRRMLSTLEKEAENRLEPVVSRLVGPSRQEIQSLSRRVHQLEQLMKQHSHVEAPTPAPAASVQPDLGPTPAGES